MVLPFIIGCKDVSSALSNGNFLVRNGVASPDFGTFGVEGNCERTAGFGFLGSTGIFNDAFVVLFVSGYLFSWSVNSSQCRYLMISMTEIHADNVHACSTQFANHFLTV